MSKNIIGIDIDNVIAATDEKIRELIWRFWGVASKQGDITSWRYSTSIGITEKQEQYVLEKLHSKYISELKLVIGAKKSLDALSDNYFIWLVTSRPSSTRELTVRWLQDNAIPFDKLFFVDNKAVLAHKTTFLVEDKPETALNFSFLGVKVYLFDYPWNRNVRNSLIVRVFSWHHLLSELETSNDLNHCERVLIPHV